MELAGLLNKTYVFRDVEPADLQALVQVSVIRRYAAGAAIFRAGDAATDLAIVISGHVAYVLSSPEGGEFYAEVMWPGRVFGEPGLFAPERQRVVDAVAVADSYVGLVPREPLVQFLLAHPIAMLRLIEGLAADARVAWTTSADLVFSQVRGRLVRRLVELVDSHDGDLVIDLSQSRLAALVGASRENVNRALRGLAAEGWVRVEGRTVTVLDLTGLRELVTMAPLISGRNAGMPG